MNNKSFGFILMFFLAIRGCAFVLNNAKELIRVKHKSSPILYAKSKQMKVDSIPKKGEICQKLLDTKNTKKNHCTDPVSLVSVSNITMQLGQNKRYNALARTEALSGVVHQIERSYGKGSIQKLGQSSSVNVETFSSGSITLDMAMGGGYPRGRVVEIYGPESSGKTTLALHAVAEIQRMGGTAAFIDAEHAMDPVYAKNLGVNVDDLLLCQPDSGEMALDVVDQLVRSSAVDIVVVDSVAALVPRAELEGDMGDTQMGLQARLMSKALRKITGSLSKSRTTVLFLNQLRSKIGIMYGNPEVTAGGNALKFYSSVRVDIRRREVLKENQGITVKVKVVKNKVAPPFRTVEFDILFGSGIDRFGCLLDAAEQLEVVERKGSWYSRGDLRFAQGRRPAIDFLHTNKALTQEIEVEVRRAMATRAVVKSPLLVTDDLHNVDTNEDYSKEFGGSEEEYME